MVTNYQLFQCIIGIFVEKNVNLTSMSTVRPEKRISSSNLYVPVDLDYIVGGKLFS